MTPDEYAADITRLDHADDYGLFDPDYDPDTEPCHTCDGDGWGIIGVDWDSDDYINGPYEGEITPCPNCGGSGLEKDCQYW